jgi:SAM-dependent methyltransferase
MIRAMLDVVELRAFYDTALGGVARRLVSRLVCARWQDHAGLRVLGLGYATPYLDGFLEKAQRVLAFMPATQGVVHWPPDGRSASALVEPSMTPLPDASMDRILIVHALETDEHPHDLLEEIWRILAPGGRVLIVAPSRTGLWARVDTTPFGQPPFAAASCSCCGSAVPRSIGTRRFMCAIPARFAAALGAAFERSSGASRCWAVGCTSRRRRSSSIARSRAAPCAACRSNPDGDGRRPRRAEGI